MKAAMVAGKISWIIVSKLSWLLTMIIWSIWGLLGALPGATFIRGSIAITLLYTTGILHIIAMLFGFDMAPVDLAIEGLGGIWDKIPSPW